MLKNDKSFSIKDVFNVRPLVVAAICQIAGIITMKNECHIFAAIVFVLLFVFTFAIFKNDKEKRLLFGIMTAFFAIGFISALILSLRYEAGEETLDGLFTGHVAKIEYNGYVYCKNVFLDGEYVGNIVFKTYDYVNVGEDISFVCEAKKRDIFGYYGVSSKMLQFFAKYEATGVEVIEVFDYSPAFDEKVRIFFKNELFKNMSYDGAALSFAMTFGDTSYLDEDLLDIMRTTGVAHIFAVSGLHVGVLYSIFNRLIKNNYRYFRLVAVPIVLFGYAYICGNSPSSLRAATMFTVMNIASCFFLPSDSINSVAIAAIVVFLISPFSVYSEGCTLSFAVVLSLIVFKNFFKDLFKIKSENNFLSTINTAVVASIGSLPLMSHYFESFSLVAVPINVIIVPLVGFIYTLTFFLVPIGGVLNVNLLRVSDLLLYFVEFICALFYRFGIVVNVKMSTFSVAVYYLIMLFLSEYCFLHKKKKAAIILCLFVALTVSFYV